MAKYTLNDGPHLFGDARDAIDAVSAFEAETLEDWAYAIRPSPDGDGTQYEVAVHQVQNGEVAGFSVFLNPTGEMSDGEMAKALLTRNALEQTVKELALKNPALAQEIAAQVADLPLSSLVTLYDAMDASGYLASARRLGR